MTPRENIKYIFQVAAEVAEEVGNSADKIRSAEQLRDSCVQLISKRAEKGDAEKRQLLDNALVLLKKASTLRGIIARWNSLTMTGFSSTEDRARHIANIAGRAVRGELNVVREIGHSHPTLHDDAIKKQMLSVMDDEALWEVRWRRWLSRVDDTGERLYEK